MALSLYFCFFAIISAVDLNVSSSLLYLSFVEPCRGWAEWLHQAIEIHKHLLVGFCSKCLAHYLILVFYSFFKVNTREMVIIALWLRAHMVIIRCLLTQCKSDNNYKQKDNWCLRSCSRGIVKTSYAKLFR